MLRELHISNLAVIADARIEFAPGLNCFTGATGAGKSLVIGAIEDRWVDIKHSQALGRAIAVSRVEVLAAGHMMISEQPAQVAALLHPHLAAN